jgi:hypothetical protein
MTIGSGIQKLLRVLPQQFESYGAGATDEDF